MIYKDEVAAMKTRAAELRQSSIDWLTTDHIKARRLLELAERFEERATLLEAASRVGAPTTFRPFTYFLGAGKK